MLPSELNQTHEEKQTDSYELNSGHSFSSEHSSNSEQLKVIKRNHHAVLYNETKITLAVTKAILAVEGASASGSERVKRLVEKITKTISQKFHRLFPEGGHVHIEDIQDQVELALMREGLHKVARAYVLYREEHAKQRIKTPETKSHDKNESTIRILNWDGGESSLALSTIQSWIKRACLNISDVNDNVLIEQLEKQVYDGMKRSDIHTSLILSARTLIEIEPNYSYVCAQLLLNSLYEEVVDALSIPLDDLNGQLENDYPQLFKLSIKQSVEYDLLNETLLTFDLERLSQTIEPERDAQFAYLGLQTLYDRYFLHWNKKRLELPQVFFMRIAMGLSINEEQPTERAIEFYQLISSFDYMCSTPTLFNAGSNRPQLSSCYLTTVDDDLSDIYGALKDNALLSKWAGGLGNDWTPVRAMGSLIKGTNGESQGVVPFLKVVNDTAVAVNQGGKRKGAVCAYLECWHLDVEDFLELRKNTGDERRRTHDMNTANWIPDLFMKRVFEDKKWTLFSPSDTPDLHDLYGSEFDARYCHYESLAKKGLFKHTKEIDAKLLWRKMLTMLFETGHPWITFKDPCNLRSPQQHMGVVHSSNLCTEITLNTQKDEIAVCNLGSVNLLNHIKNGEIDEAHLEKTVNTAVRMLDNVIDINYYPVPQAKKSNLKHRPIGLGLMGFQDALFQLNIPYASVEAVHFADRSMELLSYFALSASSKLAQERGVYESYQGSLWQKNILPIDSLMKLQQERGDEYCVFDTTSQLDWTPVRERMKQHGMRNSNVMAIAPTATISNIVGVTQSIEPTYQNLFVKSNLSGEFTVTNQWLIRELKNLNLWDNVMINDLKYFDGCLKNIDRIPNSVKELYATSFEIDSRWLVEAASRRQKWIDQAQSLNLYMSEASGKKLDNLYKLAWSRGLKTTYYLRSLGATQNEKISLENEKYGKQSTEYDEQNGIDSDRSHSSKDSNQNTHFDETLSHQLSSESDFIHPNSVPVSFCSIDDPDCEACQ